MMYAGFLVAFRKIRILFTSLSSTSYGDCTTILNPRVSQYIADVLYKSRHRTTILSRTVVDRRIDNRYSLYLFYTILNKFYV